ncbi:MAG: family 20 glycosylhydrolase [Candidatus Lokiarchaeota archaeon]|nr:family 20 glycosylhydrolase [Candidatus Lokiarchaeota archaeon]
MNRYLDEKKELAIIPRPVSVKLEGCHFVLNKETKILYDEKNEENAEYLGSILRLSTGYPLYFRKLKRKSSMDNTIKLITDKDSEGFDREGYQIKISSDQIKLTALNTHGLFYAIQTLRQLFPKQIEGKNIIEDIQWKIPCAEIKDYPRFRWRGFMLDEARYFWGKAVVKRFLDIMALLKMNIFHWHLTDDQGWRIEIKKYPKLTQVGSKRKKTNLGGVIVFKSDDKPHEGYYTQEDIKEIVKYAEKLYIKIIPEIDMPGHTMALLASYPEYSCTGGPFEVPHQFRGLYKDVLCPGNENLYEFIKNILDEIMEIFPSDILHIGGDEVPKSRWKQCKKCQAQISEEKLKDERALQIYFMNRIIDYLKKNEHTAIVWNDILSDELNKNALIQHWMNRRKQNLEELSKNRKFIMSNFFNVYLNYNYIVTPLKKTYNYEPIPEKIKSSFKPNFIGIEGALWTQWFLDFYNLQIYTFPRLFAIAETGWTQKKRKNYKSFESRLKRFNKRLDVMKINYRSLNKSNPYFLKRLSMPFHILLGSKNFKKN